MRRSVAYCCKNMDNAVGPLLVPANNLFSFYSKNSEVVFPSPHSRLIKLFNDVMPMVCCTFDFQVPMRRSMWMYLVWIYVSCLQDHHISQNNFNFFPRQDFADIEFGERCFSWKLDTFNISIFKLIFFKIGFLGNTACVLQRKSCCASPPPQNPHVFSNASCVQCDWKLKWHPRQPPQSPYLFSRKTRVSNPFRFHVFS